MVRTDRGDLIVLFSYITEEQEEAGVGDIRMIRSDDQGETWSSPTIIYRGTAGEPRTMGTLTTLSSGKLVAAVAEMGKGTQPQLVCLLTSEDGGQSWQSSAPLKFPGVNWASPYGRLIEERQGTLVMSVSVELVPDAPEQGKLCAGLMRSTDGGRNWGDFSIIASDPKVKFHQPTVLSTGDKSLVALVNNSGGLLYRCRSEDDGYHWTEPQQIQLGREPHLIRIEDETLAWVFSKGGWWGWIRIGFSYDDGQTWRCDRKVMEHPGEPDGHFGWATGLALDADHLMVVLGKTQVPSTSMDAPPSRPIAEEEERIEVVFFERDREAPELPIPKTITPPSARDRWERAGNLKSDLPQVFSRIGPDQFIGVSGERPIIWLSRVPDHKAVWGPGSPEKLWRSSDGGRTWEQQPIELPPDFRGVPSLVTQLSSGRILCAVSEWLYTSWTSHPKKILGERGGYTIWNPDTEAYDFNRLYIIYSDDDGETWQGADTPVDFSPFDWAVANEPFIERDDGTIVIPLFGCLNEKDGRERLDAGGLLRSTDGGKTWGDFSLIAHDKEQRWTAYNEAVIVAIRDDLWVTFLRTEYRGVGNESGWTSRTISTDGGYTWSQPELITLGAAFGAQKLPDGGMVLGHQGGIRFTYDLGRTWTRLAPAGGYGTPILMNDNTLLVGNAQSWGEFAVWRRITGARN